MCEPVTDIQSTVLWDQLGKRLEAFELITTSLPQNAKIVETGTVRKIGNWAGDGQSTIVWNDAAERLNGQVVTIDIDPTGAHLVDVLGLTRTVAITADSIVTLRNMVGSVDFLYLDSFDINFADPEPAQNHHLREISAAWHLLRKGSLVAVDDNQPDAGKGLKVAEFLSSRNAVELLDSYVRIWRI
jgi:predicted O-methyltransferase YrrM